MELTEIRQQIDEIDGQIARLFGARMRLCAEAGAAKRQLGLPLYDPAREEQILAQREREAGAKLAPYARRLFALLLQLSKEYQGG